MIEDAGTKTGYFANFMKSGNFFLMLILKGSMQQLWGMIRALQMVIFYVLFDPVLQANVL